MAGRISFQQACTNGPAKTLAKVTQCDIRLPTGAALYDSMEYLSDLLSGD